MPSGRVLRVDLRGRAEHFYGFGDFADLQANDAEEVVGLDKFFVRLHRPHAAIDRCIPFLATVVRPSEFRFAVSE